MVETKEKKDGASEEAKKEVRGMGEERLADSKEQKEKEEESVDKDDFMYASKPKEEEMNPDDQSKDDVELTNKVEEDDLSFLGEDYGDGEDDK